MPLANVPTADTAAEIAVITASPLPPPAPAQLPVGHALCELPAAAARTVSTTKTTVARANRFLRRCHFALALHLSLQASWSARSSATVSTVTQQRQQAKIVKKGHSLR